MKNLSTFLATYIKDSLAFGRFRDGETYDEALERILHEGIFKYRKSIIFHSPVEEQIKRIRIDAALLAVEANNPYAAKTSLKP